MFAASVDICETSVHSSILSAPLPCKKGFLQSLEDSFTCNETFTYDIEDDNAYDNDVNRAVTYTGETDMEASNSTSIISKEGAEIATVDANLWELARVYNLTKTAEAADALRDALSASGPVIHEMLIAAFSDGEKNQAQASGAVRRNYRYSSKGRTTQTDLSLSFQHPCPNSLAEMEAFCTEFNVVLLDKLKEDCAKRFERDGLDECEDYDRLSFQKKRNMAAKACTPGFIFNPCKTHRLFQ